MNFASSEFLSLVVALFAIIAAVVSIILNYFSTLKISKKHNQFKLMGEKLALYSYINFYFDKMRFKFDAIEQHQGRRTTSEGFATNVTDDELKEIISIINDRIEENYYLFRQDILKEWTYITIYYADESAKARMPKLRQMVKDEYNNNIKPEYEKITGMKIEKLS
jgi:hypothetical protein